MGEDSDVMIRRLVEELIEHLFILHDDDVGGIIWLKHGLGLRLGFERFLIARFTEAGYDHVELPFLINPRHFARQTDHAEGLAPYLYHVHSASSSQQFILRPTSEVPFTDLFGRLIGTVAPPYRFVQNVTVFRDEGLEKSTPFLRERQITPFVETYSMSLSAQDNTLVFGQEVEIYRQILSALEIPFETHLRSREDTFPEAKATIGFDIVDGKMPSWQVASVHDLGQSFATACGLTSGQIIPFQTSTGISGRALLLSLYYSWLNNNCDLRLLIKENKLPWNAYG